MRDLSAALPRDRTAPRTARALVREKLANRLSPPQLHDLQLAISELVANAVVHGEGTIQLRLQLDGDRIRGDVVDGGHGFEHELRKRGADDFDGRGLLLVSALSDRWGVHEGTTHVWFEMSLGGGARKAQKPRLGTQARPPELG